MVPSPVDESGLAAASALSALDSSWRDGKCGYTTLRSVALMPSTSRLSVASTLSSSVPRLLLPPLVSLSPSTLSPPPRPGAGSSKGAEKSTEDMRPLGVPAPCAGPGVSGSI